MVAHARSAGMITTSCIKNNDSEGEDLDQAMRRIEWEGEEEKAKIVYIKVIAEEEKRGYKRKTFGEPIAERSMAKFKEI